MIFISRTVGRVWPAKGRVGFRRGCATFVDQEEVVDGLCFSVETRSGRGAGDSDAQVASVVDDGEGSSAEQSERVVCGVLRGEQGSRAGQHAGACA